MNIKKLNKNINSFWDNKITPTLIDYIKIPNKSPSFDPEWEKHGHMQKVLNLAMKWAEEKQNQMGLHFPMNNPGKNTNNFIRYSWNGRWKYSNVRAS